MTLPNTTKKPFTVKKYIYVILIEQSFGLKNKYGFIWETVDTIPADTNGPKDPVYFKKVYREYQRTGLATRKLFIKQLNPFYLTK